MSTYNVIPATNNTNIIITKFNNETNNGQTAIISSSSANNLVNIRSDLLQYSAGSGLRLFGTVFSNTGVLTFNGRNGNINLNPSDISSALGYIPQPTGNYSTNVNASSSGTPHRIPKFIDNSGLINSIINEANYSIGINTLYPTGTLHIRSIDNSRALHLENQSRVLLSVDDYNSPTGVILNVNNTSGLPVFQAYENGTIIAGNFAQNNFVITSTGNIGIGTNNPFYKLSVNGNVGISGIITASSGQYMSIGGLSAMNLANTSYLDIDGGTP